MRNLFYSAAAAVLLLGAAQPARAEWQVAKTRHFIIYADDKPERVRDFATRLERFDQAARGLLRMSDPPVGDGNRLTVFVLPNVTEIRKLAGDTTGFLGGFYKGSVEGSVAYVPKRSDWSSEGLGAAPILYHEYAHHLMVQQLDQPYPDWYVEGFAEYLSTPRFERDGSIGLGAPPEHRAEELVNSPVPIDTLITADMSKLGAEQRSAAYGRAWLLAHYLTMEKTRQGQLGRYVTAMSAGQSSPNAARAAFGDLKQLDRELASYLQRSRLAYFKVAGARLQPGPIDIRPLTRGAAQALPARWRMKNGVASTGHEPLAAELRRIQAQFAGDELVETTLAEAEFNAGRHLAAEQAAGRALAVNARNTEAMVLKGRAMIELAATAKDGDAKQFAEARKLFIAANKVDPEDPEPLIEFYYSYLREGVRPSANAIAALHYASNLAPQDSNVRLNSAIAYLHEEKSKEARAALVPVAYSPHGGGAAAVAKAMIARIDAGDPKGAIKAGVAGGS